MRAVAALSAALCLLACHAALAAQDFPYTVIAADRAPLRASANETNEPTALLPGGTKLEVYQQDGNFLAVRPPEGSFSWVRASDLEPTGDADVLRVAASGAQAWVGHQGTDLRAISQVTLQQGEKLRVLGAIASPNNPTQAAWYQVAPPAGEFRFILQQHVTAAVDVEPQPAAPAQLASFTSRDTDTAASALPVAEPAIFSPAAATPLANSIVLGVNVMPSAAADPVGERLKQIDAQLAAMLAQPPSTWNTTALYSELQSLTSTAPSAELRTQAQNLWWRVAKCQQVQQGYAQVSTPQIAAPQPRAVPTPTIAAPPAPSRVAQANFIAPVTNPATGQPLVQPQAQSEFQPLVGRLKQLASSVNTNMQQQRTYTSTLRNRSAASTALASAEEPTHSVLAQGVTDETPATSDAETGDYAGSGWLMPLVNRSELPRDARSGVPPFALTDDAGNVKYLVTPTPGLSVSEYARKKVGVIGPTGRLPNLSNPHITAQRVVVLERHE